MYGPPVIVSQRAQMEVAFLEATWKTLDPVGITNRWINHTIHPAQTPGTLITVQEPLSSGLCGPLVYSLAVASRDTEMLTAHSYWQAE